MKLHLPKGLRQVVMAELAAVTVASVMSVTVGTAEAAWGTGQKETTEHAGWGLVLEDHFSESSLNSTYWQRIQYETKNQVNNWRATQSTAEELAQFREVEGSSALTLWGRYGKYTNQNHQTNTTEDQLAAGGIYSLNRFSFQYGFVEVRARFDCVQGCWPAIWMMPAHGKPWPQSGEIDIMEHLNFDAMVYQTLHWDNNGGQANDYSQGKQPKLSGDKTAWHTYGMEWTEAGITFYVDGNATGTLNSNSEFWPFDDENNEFYLIIDQQVGGNWVESSGAVDKQKLASDGAAFDIDYVKVWSSDKYNHLRELTWQAGDATWSEGENGGGFVSGNSVIFGEDGERGVQVAGTVHAGNMSVQVQGYNFTGKDGGGAKLEVGGILDMWEDATFTCAIELGGNEYCALTGSGNIIYTGTGEFIINTLDASGYSGTIDVSDGTLVLSTNFDATEATIALSGAGTLAFNNNNAAAGGANGDTTVTANLVGVTNLQAKGGFCVTLGGSVQGAGTLTTSRYGGAAFSACFVFDGDVSGFTGFTTSANQYNISHYAGTPGHAAYTFNAGLELTGETTFDVVKNDGTEGHETWIELGRNSRLTGSGSIVKTGEGDLRIYGDTSGYTGSIKLRQGKLLLNGINGSNIDLSLENTTGDANVVNLEGTGGVLKSVALGGTATEGKLALGEEASWNIRTVNLSAGQTLTLQGAGSTTEIGQLTGAGGTLSVQEGTLKLSGYDTYTGSISVSNGTLVLVTAPGSSGLTATTLGDGACIETALTTGTLNFGNLSIPGTTRAAGDAVLNLTGVLDGLQLQASTVSGGTLHIELTDEFISTKVAGDGYDLFAGDASAWEGHVAFDNETYGSRLKLQGSMLILEALPGLQWAGTGENHVWSTATENQDWKNSDATAAFTDGQDVLFAEVEGVSKEVTLSGPLAPQNVTVQSGEDWNFSGDGTLAATGKITVGESGPVTLTLSGTGAVSSEGLVLVGNGSKLTITSAPSSGKFNFHHIELGEGSELVLQGAAAANSAKWACEDGSGMYASGAGSIVLEGAGLLTSSKDHSGILWAFFTNTEEGKESIGHFKLRKHDNTATTLVLNGEMGSDNANATPVHGIGVVENLWVEDGNTLMVRSRVLGKTQTVRTLHLAGDGSGASFNDAGNEGTNVALDAALVLGHNATADGVADRRSSIFWNITAEADTSISVLASAAGDAYTWKLEETINTAEFTLTKKGAGILVLGVDSVLTGSGNVAVSDGLLQLAGGMDEYGGTMSLSGDARVQFVGSQQLRLFTGTITLADGGTLAFDADARLTAGSLTASASGLQFAGATNFAAGALTLTGNISVTGGATLSGEGVLKVSESSTLTLDESTYSGMKVEMESTSNANGTTSKLVLNGGSFTGNITTKGCGEITLNANAEGTINLSGTAYLTTLDGAAFNGSISLTEVGQKFGIFDANGTILSKLVAKTGDGILVANSGTVESAEGLSEVWVGGPSGTQVTIGTLRASGTNHSLTTDNGVFKDNFTNSEGHWAGNSGRVNITGEVTGYTSFTAKRKGTAVTGGIDLVFSGTVNMGEGQSITFATEHSSHENTTSYENASILFDSESTITGNGTIVKEGAGNLILAGTIASSDWQMNVNTGSLSLGKSGQDGTLNYSFTGLHMSANTSTTLAGACNLTLTGKLDAGSGILNINTAGSSLSLQHASEAHQLGTLALSADATLCLGMDAEGYASLELGTLTDTGTHQLTLQLDGLSDWLGGQATALSYELQIFTGNATGDLVTAIDDRISIVGMPGGYTYHLDENGKLTIAVDTDVAMLWNEDSQNMTWSRVSNVWGEWHLAPFDAAKDVIFAGTSTAPITVTLAESMELRESMTVQKGEGVSGNQSYTFALGDNSLTVGKNLALGTGIGVTFAGGGSVTVAGALESAGMLELSGGAQLTAQGGGSINTLKVNDGGLSVGAEKTLTVKAVESTGAGLKYLTLGQGSVLEIQTGALNITGSWTWSEGCILKLGSAAQTITLGEGLTIERKNNASLTIALTSDFMGDDAASSGTVQLFVGFKDEWINYFSFTVDEKPAGEGYYEGLRLEANGMLVWGTDNADDLYWYGEESGDTELTLGGGDTQWSDTPEGSTNETWETDHSYNVHLEATRGVITLKVAGERVDMASLSLAGGETEYQFTEDTEKVVSVKGKLSNRSKLTVGGKVTLELQGSYEGDGTLRLAGGTISVKNDRAVNGAKLELAGGTLSGEGAIIKPDTVRVESETTTSVKGVTLTGTIYGDTAANLSAENTTAGLAGDITGYTGTLNTGNNGVWMLSGKALAGDVRAAVSGNGTVQFAGAATFVGEVRGSVTLEHTGDGELVVLSEITSPDAAMSGNITLGNDKKHAVWGGRSVRNGTLTLANVTLEAGDLTKTEGSRVVVNTAVAGDSQSASLYAAARPIDGCTVNVNGMNAVKLDSITINAGGLLTGITGTYTIDKETPLTLYFTAANVSAKADGGQALIEGGSGGFTLDVKSVDSLELNLDAAASVILQVLAEGGNGETKTAYLNLLDNGELLGFDEFLATSNTLGILRDFVDEIGTDAAGNIVLKGKAQDVYVAPENATKLEIPELLNKVKATVLARATDELTLSYDADAGTVHNLLGVKGSQLHLRNANQSSSKTEKRLEITFDNTDTADIDISDYPTVEDPELGTTTVRGQHTAFDGSIDAGAGVDVKKVGYGTLSVGGNYTMTDGTTTITQGALKLRGEENTVQALTFAYTSEEQQTESGEDKRGLLLDGGRTTIAGAITEVGVGRGDIHLSTGAELVLQGESTLAETKIIGDGTGSLTFSKASGRLRLSGAQGSVQLSGVGVNLEAANAELDLGKGKNDVTFLSGSGMLKSAEGGTLGVKGGTFSGTLGVSEGGTSAGKLVVLSGASFTLSNAKSAPGTNHGNAWDVQLAVGANITVDLSTQKPGTGQELVLGDVLLGCGNMTIDFGSRAINGDLLKANMFGVGDEGTLTFCSDNTTGNDEEVQTGITVAPELRNSFTEHVRFAGLGNFAKDSEARIDDNGNLLITSREARENKFLQAMPHAGKNGRAGAMMVWDTLKGKSQWESYINALLHPSSDFEKLSYSLITMYDQGDAAGLERTLSAVAGASVATLAPALAEDLHRQLNAIRNRTTAMADDPHGVNDSSPFLHAWINAEGSYYKMNSDGFLPGYKLDNWGGTVGFDVDVSSRTTLGLALSAMYGDLKVDAADTATGDLDTAYLSAFARVVRGPWFHTFVLSGGVADVRLVRSVSYGLGCYRTSGSTTGYALGSLYELGYSKSLNEAGSLVVQPVVNVELRHASIRSYSESDSDAGLSVKDMERTVVTLGTGARIQAAVSEDAFNRVSLLEGRLLLKTDIGDRSGTSRNALIGSGNRAETESAHIGSVGVEAGLGVSIPLGNYSASIFSDASLEWRHHWVSANATLGYRMNF